MKKKIIASGLAMLTAVSAATACGSSGSSSGSSVSGGEGGQEISVCLASEPATLDPALNSAVDGATLCVHLFSGLAKWDTDSSGDPLEATYPIPFSGEG